MPDALNIPDLLAAIEDLRRRVAELERRRINTGAGGSGSFPLLFDDGQVSYRVTAGVNGARTVGGAGQLVMGVVDDADSSLDADIDISINGTASGIFLRVEEPTIPHSAFIDMEAESVGPSATIAMSADTITTTGEREYLSGAKWASGGARNPGPSPATATLDAEVAEKFVYYLTQSISLTVTSTSLANEVQEMTAYFINANGGGHTVTWPANVHWPSGGAAPAISAGVDSVTIFKLRYYGTSWFGQLIGSAYVGP